MPPDFDTTDAAVIAVMGETVSYMPGGGSPAFFDDFSRVGPALGADWTTPSTGAPASPARKPMEIGAFGTAQSTVEIVNDWHDAAYTGQPTPDDQFAEVVFDVFNGGDTPFNFNNAIGVYVRATLNAREAYFASLWYNNITSERYWEWGKLQNGEAVIFEYQQFYGTSWPIGTTVRLEVTGTTLNFYIDGVLTAGPVFDSENTSGNPCMFQSINDGEEDLVRIDNFRSGAILVVKGFFQSPDDEPDTQEIDFIATSPQVILTNVDAPSPNLGDLFTIRTVLYTVKDFEADESALVVFHLLEV